MVAMVIDYVGCLTTSPLSVWNKLLTKNQEVTLAKVGP